MSRLAPLDRATASPDLVPLFSMVEASMGFLPNSLLIMARRPDLVQAFAGLAAAINLNSDLPPGMNSMVAYVCSHASGCRYCQAHTHHSAHRSGVGDEKLNAIWNYQTSPLYNDAERAALGFAQAAGQAPVAVTDSDFAELRKHFSEQQILQLVAIVSLFGFLNRWNDTLGTPLEAEPLDYAGKVLDEHGWAAGKHSPAGR